jgi:hypothetical protein
MNPPSATEAMPSFPPFHRKWSSRWLILACASAVPAHAQLVAFEGFGDYAATQVESGSNGSPGTGLNGGAGWGGAYDVSNAIKELVKIENRSSSPVNYTLGEVTILGGDRALRFSDKAENTTSYALAPPLGTVFHATAGDVLWFSVLFRTATGGASPLLDQDFFQIGFDDNAFATSPRVSIGANTTQTTFPSPFRFFARSTTAVANSDFNDDLDIAAITTYLLVVRIQPHAGVYDTVSLFVNPSSLADPGTPSAEVVMPSGLSSLSHLFIRTRYLDQNDVYVLDEWHIGRDYASVVQSLSGALRILPSPTPGIAANLRWPVSLTNVVLESSPNLTPESWTVISGPFPLVGAEREFAATTDPESPRRFFHLRR